MASKNRTSTFDMRQRLKEDARDWSFFQAVELIQRRLDEGREVGTHLMPGDEKIVFSVDHSLGFPLSDIDAISPPIPTNDNYPDENQMLERYAMEVTFLGLHGANSPLPSYYQENIAKYDAEGSLLKGFFDFFHNRLVGLMHRTMRKYRYYVRYEAEAEDQFSQWMFSTFGLADAEARSRSSINWARLLTFAGVLATRNRSPQVMSSVVAHAFFHPDVSIEEWVQRKVDIPLNQRSACGQQNAVLGESVVLGDRVPDVSGKFRICLRNLDFERFQDFLPHGKDHRPLKDLVQFMLRDQYAYDIKLGLAPNQAEPLELEKNARGRLGWSSFLGTGDAVTRDVLITARL